MISTQPIHDTITVTKLIVDTVRATSKDSMDLLTRMDTFYNNSWSKLIMVITIAFAIIGILIPFLIQLYQKRELKLSEDRLKEDIKKEVALALEALNISSEENIKAKLDLLTVEIYAGLYHVQAHNLLIQKDYTRSLRDYTKAILGYINSAQLDNLPSALLGVTVSLEHCTKKEADKRFSEVNYTFDKFIALISKLDKHSADVLKLVTIYGKLTDKPSENEKK
ncbi:MAG: hypothetical protein V4553_16660 [Bacteroidota bacterium]